MIDHPELDVNSEDRKRLFVFGEDCDLIDRGALCKYLEKIPERRRKGASEETRNSIKREISNKIDRVSLEVLIIRPEESRSF